jgi:hypothetical protein
MSNTAERFCDRLEPLVRAKLPLAWEAQREMVNAAG